MTIAAACLTHEGVVLGADSTTTFDFVSGTRKFYNNAQKVFELGPPGQSRFGLCTWGDGLLGTVAHRTVVARLSDKVRPDTRVQDLVQELIEIGLGNDASEGRAFLGYFIAGIEPRSRLPACTRVLFGKPDEAPVITPLKMPDAMFQGSVRFFSRLHYGYDDELKRLMAAEVRKELKDADESTRQTSVTALMNLFDNAVDQLPPMQWPTMPLRDAIDYVHSYLYATVKGHKFMLGPSICGGAVEMGFLTSDRPFRWVRHKSFDSGIGDNL